MELRKFISVSLFHIVWGINDAHEEFMNGVLHVKFMKSDPVKVGSNDQYHDINFNVAVTVDELSEPSKSKLIVMGLTQLGMGSYEQLLLLVSRVEFKVPVCFVPSKKNDQSMRKFNDSLGFSH